MKCPNCNADQKDDSKFCAKCGTKLNEGSNAAENLTKENDSQSGETKNQSSIDEKPDSGQEGETGAQSYMDGAQEDGGDAAGELQSDGNASQEMNGKPETGADMASSHSDEVDLASQPLGTADFQGVQPPQDTQQAFDANQQNQSNPGMPGMQAGADMQPGFTMTGSQPGDNQGKKKGLGMKIGIGVAVVGVVAIAALGATFLGKKDPKTVVIDAFKSVYTSEKEKPIEEIFGFKNLAEAIKKENYEAGFSIMLENIDDYYLGELAGSGIEITSKNDMKSKKSSASMKVIYNDMDLVGMDVYMDSQNIMVAIPDFSEKVFTFNYADDLQGQIEDSPYLGKVLLQTGMDASFFTDYMDYVNSFYGDEEGNQPFDLIALWERYKTGSKAIDDFKTAMVVEKADKGTFEVDGKSVKCQGYDVTIPRDAVVDFLDTSSQFFLDDETLRNDILEYLTQVFTMSEKAYGMDMFGQSPEEILNEQWDDMESGVDEFLDILDEYLNDIDMRIYVDKKGRLVSLDANVLLVNEDDEEVEISVKAEFKGGTYLTQNMEFSFTAVDEDDDESVFTFEKQGTYDDKQLTSNFTIGIEDYWTDIAFDYEGVYTLADGGYEIQISGSDEGAEVFDVAISGVVEDLVKGKSFNIVADSISISADGEEVIELSGNYLLKGMEGEVTALEGEQMDILAATESEWQLVIMELYTNFSGILYQLQ